MQVLGAGLIPAAAAPLPSVRPALTAAVTTHWVAVDQVLDPVAQADSVCCVRVERIGAQEPVIRARHDEAAKRRDGGLQRIQQLVGGLPPPGRARDQVERGLDGVPVAGELR